MRRASVAQARAELSDLLDRVAHGRERVVITSRGRPKAALVSLDDLAALDDSPVATPPDESVFAEIDELVERIRRRRKGRYLSDSVEDLRAIREGRVR